MSGKNSGPQVPLTKYFSTISSFGQFHHNLAEEDLTTQRDSIVGAPANGLFFGGSGSIPVNSVNMNTYSGVMATNDNISSTKKMKKGLANESSKFETVDSELGMNVRLLDNDSAQ